MLWKLPEVTLAPDIIFNIGGFFPVTNTLLCTWITMILMFAFFFFGTRKATLIPNRYQNFVEWIVGLLLGLVKGVVGDNKAKGRRFFPLVAVFFIFILFANLLDVIPGVDTVGAIKGSDILSLYPNTAVAACQPVFGFLPSCRPLGPFLFGNISNLMVPWIRPATSDLNLTISLALVSVIYTQIMGYYHLGAKEQLLKYFNFRALRNGPIGIIEFAVGLLEIVTETARLISFSFRLFGNIFAGSILLAVFAFILPVVATIVFIPFEIFVAVVQALVFSMLTLVFMEIGTSSHGEHAEGAHEEEEMGATQKVKAVA